MTTLNRIRLVFLTLMCLAAAGCSVEEPSSTTPAPCPEAGATPSDAGVAVPDAMPEASTEDGAVTDAGVADGPELYDPCNADYQRGKCDDRLLPNVWGFEARCETDGGKAYKLCMVASRKQPCFIPDELRAKCVTSEDGFVCCPEY